MEVGRDPGPVGFAPSLPFFSRKQSLVFPGGLGVACPVLLLIQQSPVGSGAQPSQACSQ